MRFLTKRICSILSPLSSWTQDPSKLDEFLSKKLDLKKKKRNRLSIFRLILRSIGRPRKKYALNPDD